MTDKEKKPLNKKGQDGKDTVVEEEEEQGCCSKVCDGLTTVFAFLYKCTVFVLRAARDCVAFLWYPCKERCCGCIRDKDKKMNPWKDPSYSHL